MPPALWFMAFYMVHTHLPLNGVERVQTFATQEECTRSGDAAVADFNRTHPNNPIYHSPCSLRPP